MRKIVKLIGALFFAAAMGIMAWGVHVTNVRRATVDHFATLYDGPWLPLEFLFLGVGVLLIKSVEAKGKTQPTEPASTSR